MKKIPTYNFSNIGRKEKLVDVLLWNSYEPYVIDDYHNHDYHEIIIFYQGEGEHKINGTIYPIKSHSIHIVPKIFLHKLTRSSNTLGFTIAMSDLFIKQLMQFDPTTNYGLLFEKESTTQLSTKSFTSLQYYFTEIQKSNGDALTQNLCAVILLKLYRFLSKHLPHQQAPYEEVKRVLKENFMNRLSAVQYASMLNTSSRNLNLKLKKATGKTISQLQNEMLVSKIKQDIYLTDKNLKEIAYLYGFNDYAHFSKFFKQFCGCSPKDYKNALKNYTYN